MKKEVLLIGLGRMGGAIAHRLKNLSWRVVGYAKTKESRERARKELGIEVIEDYEEFGRFEGERLFWIMVPHTAVDEVLNRLKLLLKEGDTVVDGGNSFYKDSVRRYEELSKLGVNFLDVGVSGGVLGKGKGFSLMIGGDEEAFRKWEHLFRDLAYEGKGYAYLGKSGAGHYAKMVHNGIEYGIMEAIGEGFELLKESPYDYDLKEVARVYKEGSIIRSFLMELLEKAFQEFGNLEEVEGYVEDSGEGRWCVKEAVDRGVSLNVIANSLFGRFDSRKKDIFRNKVLAVLRYEFGRHPFRKKD
ncbi:decarboxylating 6-phosphogluconate dehydrogenase [Aquifex pyrophilus]